MSIKVGIFFGGPSREREISFAGGRTVYDNLNKTLFEAVPIFVDSFRNWYLLDWEYLYKGSIRDFFPPVPELPESTHGFQVYQESLGPLSEPDFDRLAKHVGKRVRKFELNELIDVAFLALHGEYGEDGILQAELDRLGMPYTGSGVRACQIGIDKALQKELMAGLDFPTPPIQVLSREEFFATDLSSAFETAAATIGWPLVVRPANQGSSIGVSIIEEEAGLSGFEEAVNRAFFREVIPLSEWADRGQYEQEEYVRMMADIRDGLGFPVDAVHDDHRLTIYHPEDLLSYFQEKVNSDPQGVVTLIGHQGEERVLLEGFIRGREFSCIVLRTEGGDCLALPPTEIVKGGEVFDYRSKYLPGLSRKITPIDLEAEQINVIRRECERLFRELGFGAYARIDGFQGDDGKVYLNDPNTTSGMLPSSFFFHQAAEIGLNPSQFLTYIIRVSLLERTGEGNEFATTLAEELDRAVKGLRQQKQQRKKVAVLLGGSSFERHISVESGRNIFEKLASSDQYAAVPVFLTAVKGNGRDFKVAMPNASSEVGGGYALFQLPINLLLKDNADDIRDKVFNFKDHPILAEIRRECAGITAKYADRDVVFAPRNLDWDDVANEADAVFIALHGRPGEDGQVQMQLEARGIPYNGSSVSSSSLTINKYRTLQQLKQAGFPVADQWLASKEEFVASPKAFYESIEGRFGYPLIAKPVDDGCSSAVKVIKNRVELSAYCQLMFKVADLNEKDARKQLKLKAKEEFPTKGDILFEELITAGDAVKFLEITGGMLMHAGEESLAEDRGYGYFEVFEPSEALAGGEVLSLEEKFLAGEGQNLTPARLYTDDYDYEHVAQRVKADLKRVAENLGVTGYCRIDAFVRIFADGKVETIVIEVNSLPGMTPATAIFHQAAVAGMQPYQFIDRLLAFGFAREEKRRTLATAEASTLVTPATMEADRTRVETVLPPPTSPTPHHLMEKTAPSPPPSTASTEPVSFWDKLKAFVSHPYFWRNVGVLFGGLLLSFLLLRGCLSVYTHHGEAIELPDFVNMHLDDVKKVVADRDLKIDVSKGAFDPDREPGIVTLQQPVAGSRVKRNRTIYLTVLSDEAPMVQLPKLTGNYDYGQYTQGLEPFKIDHYVADMQFDPKQEDSTILHFYYDDQKITEDDLYRGVKIPAGSRLGFVLTVRRTGEVAVPDLRCQRYNEALFVISATNINVGEVLGNFSDRNNAYITSIDPPIGQMMDEGGSINLYLSDQRPDDCE